MKVIYSGNDNFIRRYLYVDKKLSKKLDVEAAQNSTDASDILNIALANYFDGKDQPQQETEK